MIWWKCEEWKGECVNVKVNCECMKEWNSESVKEVEEWEHERVEPFERASKADHHNQKKVCHNTENSKAGEGMCDF